MEGHLENIHRARVDSSGRIAIPALARTRLGIHEGDELVILEEVDGLRVCTLDHAIRAAQELYATYVPAGVSLADELHKERREEAARD